MSAHGRLGAAGTVVVLVAALFSIRLARFAGDRYSADALYHLGAAARVAGEPLAFAAPDYTGRRHPLFTGSLALLELAFGPRLAPLLVLAYLGHLAAALLLWRLAAALGAGPTGALAAAVLFAAFPGANTLFADPIHYERPWGLALALGSLGAALRGRRAPFLVLYVLSLLSFEDAVLLPLAALALDRIRPSPPASVPRLTAPWHLAAVAVMAIWLAGGLLGGGTGQHLSLGTHVVRQAARLPLEIARSSLVPRSDVIESPWIRWGLALPAVLGFLWALRPRQIPWRTVAGLAVVAAAFAAPYLGRPLEGAWQARYLYFPAAGLLGMAGAALAGGRRWAVAVVLVQATIIGASTTERAADVIAARHLLPLRPEEAQAVVRSIAASLAGEDLPLRLDDAGCAFVAGVHTPRPIPCTAR